MHGRQPTWREPQPEACRPSCAPCCRLAARGLALRTDSRLCQQYIQGAKLSLGGVVNIMDEMRFYFAHTDYEETREGLREVRPRIRSAPSKQRGKARSALAAAAASCPALRCFG